MEMDDIWRDDYYRSGSGIYIKSQDHILRIQRKNPDGCSVFAIYKYPELLFSINLNPSVKRADAYCCLVQKMGSLAQLKPANLRYWLRGNIQLVVFDRSLYRDNNNRYRNDSPFSNENGRKRYFAMFVTRD
ncbi:hypothetical protein TNCV_1762541 [Trichonephila clavipes]|nr:hypothetical protein TNCV_1762541 [Trichonephila clavipes]